MTKASIIKELMEYGVDATFRPRKTTLIALLEEKREEMMAKPMKVTTDEWMEFTKVESKWGWRDYTVAGIILIGGLQAVMIGAALILNGVL